jgi:hypothetical protein
VHSRNVRQGWGVGPKLATELLWLGCGRAVRDGGGGLCVGWYDGAYKVMVVVGGCVLMKREAGVGGWAKTRNQAAMAWLRTGKGLQEVEGGTVGLQAPLPC